MRDRRQIICSLKIMRIGLGHRLQTIIRLDLVWWQRIDRQVIDPAALDQGHDVSLILQRQPVQFQGDQPGCRGNMNTIAHRCRRDNGPPRAAP